jgi:hypothetical protein
MSLLSRRELSRTFEKVLALWLTPIEYITVQYCIIVDTLPRKCRTS